MGSWRGGELNGERSPPARGASVMARTRWRSCVERIGLAPPCRCSRRPRTGPHPGPSATTLDYGPTLGRVRVPVLTDHPRGGLDAGSRSPLRSSGSPPLAHATPRRVHVCIPRMRGCVRGEADWHAIPSARLRRTPIPTTARPKTPPRPTTPAGIGVLRGWRVLSMRRSAPLTTLVE